VRYKNKEKYAPKKNNHTRQYIDGVAGISLFSGKKIQNVVV